MSLEILVDNQVLERCDHIKYLGVIVDKQLNWRKHLESVQRKRLSALALLNRVKRSSANQTKEGSSLQYTGQLCYNIWIIVQLSRLSVARMMPTNWRE